ncbi:MAG: GntR family transcriptional regulator [Sphaerochaeta sp.]|jgi:DNA-binding GntR family transcriptional regulator|nr:GntR family transcriptional regulator [Sphaerochaeta sp.]
MPGEEDEQSVIESVYQELRLEILRAVLLPGTKLSENALAKDFSCSRTPVREALQRLRQDGFVDILPHSGTYVRTPKLCEYLELTEVRAYLEALAFTLAIERNADCTTLRTILTEMDEIVQDTPIDTVAFGVLHYRFHHTLVEMSGNSVLLRIYDRLNLSTSSLFSSPAMTRERFSQTQAEHHKILTALENHDTRMEKAIIQILWRKRNRYKRGTETGVVTDG